MAKYALRVKARKLRQEGVSVKQIAKQLGVSKGTASLWVRDIILTVEQLEKLRQAVLKGSELGRLRNALKQKEKRLNIIEEAKKNGYREVGNLTNKELLVAGLALYWGEGSKRNGRLELCNSDPKMIQFFMFWLEKCFSVSIQNMRCRVGINELHRERDVLVQDYWSRITGIPLSQFAKTSFKKVINKKTYANFDNHYGTLALSVAKPGQLYYKILGLIDGFSVGMAG